MRRTTFVILTVADSELAAVSQAAHALGDGAPRVRSATLLRLKHPYCVDVCVERAIARARLAQAIGLRLWRPQSNSAADRLDRLAQEPKT